MPLVKKQSGWFWGSKGPFDSKTKALAVARAAYAHGYKGESVTSDTLVAEHNKKLSSRDLTEKKSE